MSELDRVRAITEEVEELLKLGTKKSRREAALRMERLVSVASTALAMMRTRVG